jgi:hypothetical protein
MNMFGVPKYTINSPVPGATGSALRLGGDFENQLNFLMVLNILSFTNNSFAIRRDCRPFIFYKGVKVEAAPHDTPGYWANMG